MQQNESAAPGFLAGLRAATTQSHEDLEAHPLSRLIAGEAIGTAGYVQYLQAMQGVVENMEGVIYPVLAHMMPDLKQRRKLPWITADLAALGGLPNPMPEAHIAREDMSADELLGMLYVLEGSALGGRVILKGLPPEIVSRGARYFEGYGKETGPMWKSFLAALTAQGEESPQRAAAMIAGAEEAFRGIHTHFNQCADASQPA